MGSSGTIEAETPSRDRRLDEVCGHLNVLNGQLVDIAAEVITDGSVLTNPGIHSHRQYLAWRCGISSRRAGQVVKIAECAGEFPRCVQLLRDGLISLDQLAVITEHAPAWADRQLVDVAEHMTVAQLRRTIAAFPCLHDADQTDEKVGDDAGDPAAERDRHTDTFTMRLGPDGRFVLHVETDDIAGMIVRNALEEARDALFQHTGEPATWVAALVEMAQRSLDQVPDANTSRRDRFRVHLHIDTDQPSTARDARGWSVSEEVRRYLSCDAELVPTLIAEGTPVSVGRSTRVVPERTRRLVILRDQGCRVPGCTATSHLEIHHIIHWTDDGPTEMWNLIALCPHHHRLHHRGELHIAGDAEASDGVTFTARNGAVITASGARPEPPGAPPPTPARPYRGPTGERLDLHWITFTPPPDGGATTN